MTNMFLCFRSMGKSIEKFGEMISTPKFWYIVIALIGLIILIVNCLKHPKVGKWVLFGVFYIGFLILTVYSCIQLNIHYKTKGGIFGQISGIFEPNQVKVVDDITYEFTNTELVQVGETNKYSSSVSVPEIMNLENGVKYQLLINDVPSGYTDNNEDYIVSRYNYIFYDEDFNILKQDTLIIKIAFYANSTSFSVSTEGGAEAVKYWNYYFNKNKFVVTLTGKADTSNEPDYSTGDVSNYVTVKYVVNNVEIKSQAMRKGSQVDLSAPDITKFEYWTFNGKKVTNLVADENIVLVAYITPDYTCNFVVDGKYYASKQVYRDECVSIENPANVETATEKTVFDYWTVDNIRVDLSIYPITQDTTFVAKLHKEYLVHFEGTGYYSENPHVRERFIEENGIIDIVAMCGYPPEFVVKNATIDGQTIDFSSYVVTKSVTIIFEGNCYYTCTFIVNNNIYKSLSVEYKHDIVLPDNPVVDGYTFKGWSTNSKDICDDSTFKDIRRDITFTALLTGVHTLTILSDYDGDVIAQVQEETGYEFSVLTPTSKYSDNVSNSTFVWWRNLSGSCTFRKNDNYFTFIVGDTDCVVYAYYNFCKIKVSYPTGLLNTEKTNKISVGSTNIENIISDTFYFIESVDVHTTIWCKFEFNNPCNIVVKTDDVQNLHKPSGKYSSYSDSFSGTPSYIELIFN